MCTHVDVLNQEKHSCPTTINIEMILLLTMLWMLFIHIYWNYTDNHVYFISMPFMGCSRLVIGEGSHASKPQSCSARPRLPDIRGALSVRFVLYSMFVQLYLHKYPIFVIFLDKIKYLNSPISQYEYRYEPWYCHHYASDIIVCRSHHRWTFTFQHSSLSGASYDNNHANGDTSMKFCTDDRFSVL